MAKNTFSNADAGPANKDQAEVESSEAIEKVPIATWEAFKTYVSHGLYESDSSGIGDYLFRGVQDEFFRLKTSFDRAFNELADSKRSEAEKLLVANFRKECECYPAHRDQLDSDVDCLALAQHHGLPTRLLDWTESPYIAAFFAFQQHLRHDGDREKNLAIWVLNRGSKYRHLWDATTGVELVSLPTWHNERMQRQCGWFTHARTPFRTLEQYVVAMQNPRGALRKIIMPVGEAYRAMADLDLMGINHHKLFPDLTGAADSAFIRTCLVGQHRFVAPDA